MVYSTHDRINYNIRIKLNSNDLFSMKIKNIVKQSRDDILYYNIVCQNRIIYFIDMLYLPSSMATIYMIISMEEID